MSVPRFKIVNAEPSNYSVKARAILDEFAEVVDGPFTRSQLLNEIVDADVVIVRLSYKVDGDFFRFGKKLKAIVTATTGLNHVDMVAAKKAGVEVLCLRGEFDFLSQVTATAEHTWALLLALFRNVPRAVASTQSGQWDRNAYLGRDLSGLTLGIIGYGRLGKIVAEYAKAFRMDVLVYDIDPSSCEGSTSVSLKTLLEKSDVVSMHASLNEDSVGLLGKKEFGFMKPGACFINTARGELVDEVALLKSLESGRLAGAAIDVLCDEVGTSGIQGGDLVQYSKERDNLIITPHIGGATHDSMWKTEIFMAEKLKKYLTVTCAS